MLKTSWQFLPLQKFLLQLLQPDAKRLALDKARELTREEPLQRALWMANALDTADSGISVFSGVKSAVAMYQAREGERLDALEVPGGHRRFRELAVSGLDVRLERKQTPADLGPSVDAASLVRGTSPRRAVGVRR